jgi:hypothetical protein
MRQCEIHGGAKDATNDRKRACASHAAQLMLQKHIQNTQYLLHFQGNNSYANAPHC